MLTQYKRTWLLLISSAACAGLATTPAFAGEPHALTRLVEVGDAQYVGKRESKPACSALEDTVADTRVCISFVGKHTEALSQVAHRPPENAQVMYLIKLLEGSSQFRVRAQAAISLGMTEASFAARNALTAALQDPHPAVRAAAATSLGHIGESNHVIALRTLATDPEEPVRNAARASIGMLESEIEESPFMLGAATTTAARSAATSAIRL